MAKRKPTIEDFPDQVAADAKWKDFCERLDRLDRSVAQLLELGEFLLQALKESATYTGNPLLGLINKVVSTFREARQDYRDEER